jgi:hypothetical protein
MKSNISDKDAEQVASVIKGISQVLPDKIAAEVSLLFARSRQHCLDCIKWNAPGEYCEKYNQKPPLDVIVKGCREFDDIPF